MRARLPMLASGSERACPDCPAARRGRLVELIGDGHHACQLQSHALEARSVIPSGWSERFAFAIVRRGWVVRSRIDGRGHHTAVDLVGPGSMVPLRSGAEGSVPGGFAATRAVLCLCPRAAVDADSVSASLAFELFHIGQETLERVERIADARGRETATEKVAALLDVLVELRGDRPGVRGLPDGLQQRDVAALLQLRPETVCRALRSVAPAAARPT